MSVRPNLYPVRWIPLGLIVLLAAVLRFYDLGGESFWYDEVIMLHVAQGDLETMIASGRPPVYVVLARFWLEAFGTSEVAARSLSALAGVLGVLALYLVGQELFDKRVGLTSAFIMAISQFQVFYSQDFRYYSLFVLVTLISFLFFIKALRNGQPIHFVLYVLSAVLLFYTHTFGIFVITAQGLYFLGSLGRYAKIVKPWFVCQIMILFAMTPRFFNLADKAESGRFAPGWLREPTFSTLKSTLRKFVKSGFENPSSLTISIALLFVCVGVFIFVYWIGWRKWLSAFRSLLPKLTDLQNMQDQLLLLALWLAAPILLPFALSQIIEPMYHHRYTISASPALYLLLGLALSKLRCVIPEAVSLGALLIILAPGLNDFYARTVKEQWREVAKFVESHEEEGDVIVIADTSGGEVRDSFDWYYQGNLPDCSVYQFLNDDQEMRTTLEPCLAGRARIWFVVRNVTHRENRLESFVLEKNHEEFRLLDQRAFKGITVHLLRM